MVIEKGMFSWGNEDDKCTLTNINVRIKYGSLVAIVGPVGCGKSSLLSAFLGEMNKLQGYVNTKVYIYSHYFFNCLRYLPCLYHYYKLTYLLQPISFYY